MKKIELLSPAGSFESLVAAINSGADAVYFGTDMFNARAFATNFAGESAKVAIDYAHERGVRVNITLNTLLLDREIKQALYLAQQLYEWGVDALLVQDVGLISLLRENLPQLPLHASTQMAIHNLDGVLAAEKLGLKRIVLARETALSDIRYIKQHCNVELEAFVHGAMCVSVSGQCLMSSFIGARSGNRGQCAQPCRLAYDFCEKNGYMLSMKDLCMLEHVGEMIEAGITSLKIEGRMKSPAYVAAVTGAYRRALDNQIGDMTQELTTLKRIFDRGEFSTGYYYSREDLVDTSRSGHEGLHTKESLPVDKLQLIDAHLYAKEGKSITLKLQLGDIRAQVCGEVAQLAKNAPLTVERAKEAVAKLGGTPFRLENFTADIGSVFLPVSVLNDLRRRAVEALLNALRNQYSRPPQPILLHKLEKRSGYAKPTLIAQCARIEQAQAAVQNGAKEIYAQPRDWSAKSLGEWADWAKGEVPVLLALPPVLLEHENDILFTRIKKLTACFSGAVAANIGQIASLAQLWSDVRTDYTLNVFNSYSALAHKDMGLTTTTLSVELTQPQLRDFIAVHPDSELIVYGRVPLMNLMHCPIRREKGGCDVNCMQGCTITDRKNYRFTLLPLTIERACCNVQLLNCIPLDTLKLYDELHALGAKAWRMIFTTETAQQTAERTNAYAQALDGGETLSLPDSTGGHYARGVG